MAKEKTAYYVPFKNSHSLFLSAESFYLVSNLIHTDVINKMREKDYTFLYQIHAAMVANHALSIELYLKCLSVLEKQKYLSTHNLLELYEDLEIKTQQILNDYFKKFIKNNEAFKGWRKMKTMPRREIKTLLKLAENAFITFRYNHEQKHQSYLVADVANAAKKYLIELNPDWKLIKVRKRL